MDGIDEDPVVDQLPEELLRAVLRLHEDETRRLELALREELPEAEELPVLVRDEEQLLLHVRSCGVDVADAHAHRVGEEGPRQLADGRRQRRGEHHGLELEAALVLRAVGEDLIDLRCEAQVQELVRLVQYEVAASVQRDSVLPQHLCDAQGRCNGDIQPLDVLRLVTGELVQHSPGPLPPSGELCELVKRLLCQLPGGIDDETAGELLAGLAERRKDRAEEGDCLSATSWRRGENMSTGHDHGEALHLDRGGLGEAQGLHVGYKPGRHTPSSHVLEAGDRVWQTCGHVDAIAPPEGGHLLFTLLRRPLILHARFIRGGLGLSLRRSPAAAGRLLRLLVRATRRTVAEEVQGGGDGRLSLVLHGLHRVLLLRKPHDLRPFGIAKGTSLPKNVEEVHGSLAFKAARDYLSSRGRRGARVCLDAPMGLSA
mmetsp:Transcript_102840/g.221993  ORF Transcript_102840/g.221993 Transcript_102840/m.221993 type:complete len:428 (+) Transcript_102840:657-1940(+)